MPVAHRHRQGRLWLPDQGPAFWQRVEIDWSHPLAQGLVGYWLPNLSFMRSLVPGVEDFTPENGGIVQPSVGRIGFGSGVTENVITGRTPDNARHAPTTGYSVLASVALKPSGGSAGGVLFGDIQSQTGGFTLYQEATLAYIVFYPNINTSAENVQIARALDYLPHQYAAVFTPSLAAIYVDTAKATRTSNAIRSSSNALTIGGAQQFNGAVSATSSVFSCFSIYERALSDGEVEALRLSPFAMLRPQRTAARTGDAGINPYTVSGAGLISGQGARATARADQPTRTLAGNALLPGIDAEVTSRHGVTLNGLAGLPIPAARGRVAEGAELRGSAALPTTSARGQTVRGADLAGSAALPPSTGRSDATHTTDLIGSALLSGMTARGDVVQAADLSGTALLAGMDARGTTTQATDLNGNAILPAPDARADATHTTALQATARLAGMDAHGTAYQQVDMYSASGAAGLPAPAARGTAEREIETHEITGAARLPGVGVQGRAVQTNQLRGAARLASVEARGDATQATRLRGTARLAGLAAKGETTQASRLTGTARLAGLTAKGVASRGARFTASALLPNAKAIGRAARGAEVTSAARLAAVVGRGQTDADDAVKLRGTARLAGSRGIGLGLTTPAEVFVEGSAALGALRGLVRLAVGNVLRGTAGLPGPLLAGQVRRGALLSATALLPPTVGSGDVKRTLRMRASAGLLGPLAAVEVDYSLPSYSLIGNALLPRMRVMGRFGPRFPELSRLRPGVVVPYEVRRVQITG